MLLLTKALLYNYFISSYIRDKVAGKIPVNQHQNKYMENHKSKTQEYLSSKEK